jgi:hypothetical protein
LNVSDYADEPPLTPAPVAAPPAAPPARVRRPRWRTPVLIVLVLAGVAGLAAGGFGLHKELTRRATAAEAAAAGRAEIATRWQRLPAGRLFPATISYLSAGKQQTTAVRVGIAPATSCTAALDPAAEAIFHGCRTMLRATYSDKSGSLAVTVGIAVMRSTAAAQSAVSNLTIQPGHAGVRAVSFPGTLVSGYGDAQRGWFHVATGNGPYAFFYAAGFADGRHGSDNLTSEPQRLGSGVLSRLIAILTGGGTPCSRADIRC